MQALLNAIATMDVPTDAARIFHGRGGLHPGCEHWVLDAYPPVWVATSFAPVSEAELQVLGEALEARWQQIAPGQPLNWVFQSRHGAQATTQAMAGSVPEMHTVSEDGALYRMHVLRGQNHGLFLDMAEGRRWVRAHCDTQPRMKVLNLFAYTCAFSVAALQGGARQVVNMDMAAAALGIGQQNHQLNGLGKGQGGSASFWPHDVFTSWGKIGRAGPYDLVIADPPSYQKGSFVATKDYARLVRRLPSLLMYGGHALLCLNAPELGPEFLQALVAEQAPELEFIQRLPNPPAFADADPARALKVLLYRLPPEA